jgi:hypothetical protein
MDRIEKIKTFPASEVYMGEIKNSGTISTKYIYIDKKIAVIIFLGGIGWVFLFMTFMLTQVQNYIDVDIHSFLFSIIDILGAMAGGLILILAVGGLGKIYYLTAIKMGRCPRCLAKNGSGVYFCGKCGLKFKE